MEDITDFMEAAAGGILFCLAVWLLFSRLKLLPGGVFPHETNRYEAVYVREQD